MTKQKLIKLLSILLIILATILVKPVLYKMIGLLLLMIITFTCVNMKNKSLLKTILILTLYLALTSFILVGRQGNLDYIGVGDVVLNVFKAISYFFYILAFIFSIGGFYGVLNKTQSYQKMVDTIVSKLKPFGKRIIFIIISIIAIITSVTGISLPLFIFIPLIVSIILLLGYDKLVALSATIGSVIVGYIGGLFITIFNPNTNSLNTYETFVGLTSKFENIFPKLLLLFAGIALLVYYVNKHISDVENKKVKYELNENKDLVVNEVGDYQKTKIWPIAIIFTVLFLLVAVALIPWNSLFEIKWFINFHTWLTSFTEKFPIFNNLISSELQPLGEWMTYGDSLGYMTLSFVLIIFTFVIALIDKMKFDQMIDEYTNGMKKILPAAVVVLLSYSILVDAYLNGFIENLITTYGKFNYGVSSLQAILGILLYTDQYYISASVFLPILNLITDEAIYASVAILLQGLSGIVQLIAPTSILLILCVKYFDVPYSTWLKYIWRFILSLIILLSLVVILVVLL